MGALAEWFKALLLRVKTNQSQRIPGLPAAWVFFQKYESGITAVRHWWWLGDKLLTYGAAPLGSIPGFIKTFLLLQLFKWSALTSRS